MRHRDHLDAHHRQDAQPDLAHAPPTSPRATDDALLDTPHDWSGAARRRACIADEAGRKGWYGHRHRRCPERLAACCAGHRGTVDALLACAERPRPLASCPGRGAGLRRVAHVSQPPARTLFHAVSELYHCLWRVCRVAALFAVAVCGLDEHSYRRTGRRQRPVLGGFSWPSAWGDTVGRIRADGANPVGDRAGIAQAGANRAFPCRVRRRCQGGRPGRRLAGLAGLSDAGLAGSDRWRVGQCLGRILASRSRVARQDLAPAVRSGLVAAARTSRQL